MSQGITRDDLDKWGDRFKDSLGELLTAKLAAMPCAAHDERLTGLAAKADRTQASAQEAFTVAQGARLEADLAKDLATGNLWKVAKIGLASLCAGAGFKLSSLAHIISETVRHHKP